jgi:hypothetical protein
MPIMEPPKSNTRTKLPRQNFFSWPRPKDRLEAFQDRDMVLGKVAATAQKAVRQGVS